MEKQFIAQDNRLTSARYDLSLTEKKTFFFIIREVRKQFVVNGIQRSLFENLIVNINPVVSISILRVM